MITRPFAPEPGSVITIAATTASASAALADPQKRAGSIRVLNAGSSDVRVRWGNGAQTAVATDMRIPAGAVEVFTKANADTVAAICDTGSTTVEFTFGEGI